MTSQSTPSKSMSESAPAPTSVSARVRVLSIIGTRPEAIKMAPVLSALEAAGAESRLCVTGQHQQMLEPLIDLFELRVDHDLATMIPQQSLSESLARLLQGIGEVISHDQPQAVLVQGDTSSALAGALAGFYAGVPVGHVEAGLRSATLDAPFPEEGHRRMIDTLATWCFAPTEHARRALLAEGYCDDRIEVTGNTVIDALEHIRRRPPSLAAINSGGSGSGLIDTQRPLILVTAHRRESFGEGLERICLALRRLAEERPELTIVLPVHLNPTVSHAIRSHLAKTPNIHLIDPLPYDLCLELIHRSVFVLTDSGGLQEEAPSLGTPVLVMRDITERHEGLDAGVARLVGSDPQRIVEESLRLLDDPQARRAMTTRVNPYGDGRAAVRIAASVLQHLAAQPGQNGI